MDARSAARPTPAETTPVLAENRALDRISHWVHMVIILAAVGVSLVQVDVPVAPSRLLTIAVLSLTFVGLSFADRGGGVARATRAQQRLYFGLLLALAAALLGQFAALDTFGMAWLVLMPLVALARLVLPPVDLFLVCLITLGMVGTHIRLIAGWQALPEALLGFAAALFFVLLFTSILRREAEARRELAVANRSLQRQAREAEELAISHERNHLAREIHDSVGHTLTVVSVQLEAALATLERDPEAARKALRTAGEQTRHGLAEIRHSVSTLRDSAALPPLSEALSRLVDEHRQAGLELGWQLLGEARRLPLEAELALYRSAQEALTNVHRHAAAGCAELSLDFRDPDRVGLRLADDGRGASQPEAGFGLLGLGERVRLLDGQLRIRTRAGAGFELQVELPG